ncbi:DsbA family protein [Fibrisoma limi]|nr:thioredoxin domain-containing protein [Fibrisoma limi]
MIELIEYGDFMCPRCRNTRQLLLTLLKIFSGQIQYTYRHFPNPSNSESWLAAVAAEAAGMQGQFDPMYQALFTQRSLQTGGLSELAFRLGLDVKRFLADLQDEQVYHSIEADRRAGYQLGIQTTPTLVIEGQRFYGSLTLARLSPFIRHHIRRKSSSIFNIIDPKTGLVRWADDAL